MRFENWWREEYLRVPKRCYTHTNLIKFNIVSSSFYNQYSSALDIETIINYSKRPEVEPDWSRIGEDLYRLVDPNPYESLNIHIFESQYLNLSTRDKERYIPVPKLNPRFNANVFRVNYPFIRQFKNLPEDWMVAIRDFLVFQKSLLEKYFDGYTQMVERVESVVNANRDVDKFYYEESSMDYIGFPSWGLKPYKEFDNPFTFCYNNQKIINQAFERNLKTQIESIENGL